MCDNIHLKVEYNSVNDDVYCGCGSKACASLIDSNGVRISLCKDCINELTSELDKFNKTTFCHMRDNFIPDSFGNYGKCKRDLCSKYSNHIMDTCKYAVPKQK